MRLRKAVLVIHGFGSGTWENEFLVNYLNYDRKLDTYTFTLPGHHKDYIRKVKYQDWIDACKQEMEKLVSKYNSIYLVGHSMGGVIAAYMATQYSQVKKLVLIAPAFEYINFEQNKIDITETLRKRKEKKESTEEIYPDITAKLFHIAPTTFLEFIKLVKTYKNCTKKVVCDTLIIYGEKDELVPYKSIKYALDTIPSKRKYLTKVKNARHRILVSKRKREVSEYIRIFLRGGLKWNKTKKSNM